MTVYHNEPPTDHNRPQRNSIISDKQRRQQGKWWRRRRKKSHRRQSKEMSLLMSLFLLLFSLSIHLILLRCSRHFHPFIFAILSHLRFYHSSSSLFVCILLYAVFFIIVVHFGSAKSEGFVILACIILIQLTSVTDGQMPRRWLRRAMHSAIVRNYTRWWDTWTTCPES